VTLINGDTASAPLEIVAGVPQRFRFINIGPANRLVFAIRRDSSVVTWRRLAKDGADLPPAMAVAGPAAGRLAVGEMFDAEFIAPTRGEYTLTVGSPKKQMRYRRRIIVR